MCPDYDTLENLKMGGHTKFDLPKTKNWSDILDSLASEILVEKMQKTEKNRNGILREMNDYS